MTIPPILIIQKQQVYAVGHLEDPAQCGRKVAIVAWAVLSDL